MWVLDRKNKVIYNETDPTVKLKTIVEDYPEDINYFSSYHLDFIDMPGKEIYVLYDKKWDHLPF